MEGTEPLTQQAPSWRRRASRADYDEQRAEMYRLARQKYLARYGSDRQSHQGAAESPSAGLATEAAGQPHAGLEGLRRRPVPLAYIGMTFD